MERDIQISKLMHRELDTCSVKEYISYALALFVGSFLG